jgi:hypothetical protein
MTFRHSSWQALALIVLAAVSTGRCARSSTSPTAPDTGSALSAVVINAQNLTVGGTAQGTITLSTAASAATSVTMTSSNTSIVTVQSPVTVAAGASSAAFTVTGVGPGTATVTASLNGNTRQSASINVGSGVQLASITLNATSVVGGNQVGGTVTLTGAAPVGGAAVTLSAADPLLVPASVTVPAGSSSATFTVSTRAVGGSIAGTITASYGGGTATVSLSVTKPTTAIAKFGVTGPTESETCTMSASGGTLNCTFNGTTSSAPGTIVAYDWTFAVATKFSQTTTGPILANPAVSCVLLPPAPLPEGVQWLTMTVTLRVRDDLGNISAEAVNDGVRLIPRGACGY